MLWIMCRFRRRPEETLDDMAYRGNSRIKEVLSEFGIAKWDNRVHQIIYAWAGHVSRFTVYDPDRITLKVLRYRDRTYLKKREASLGGEQGHGRKFHPWRWEAPLVKYYGKRDWHEAAADKESWQKSLDAMAAWRIKNR